MRRRVLLVLIATLALLGAGATIPAGAAPPSGPSAAPSVSPTDDPPAPPGTPTATSFAGTPLVGPLFFSGTGANHGCTASVLASPTRDLILTAAHCIQGTGAGVQFAPGYDDGATPYGVWTATQAYVDPGWVATQDPRRDYAILRVAGHVQDVTGGSLLGRAPRPGERITDIAYNAGLDDRPIRCTVPAYLTDGYPSFNCHGYVGGSSGSPWLTYGPGPQVAVVHGVIGGLHQGGCFEYTSYSSPFDAAAYRLLLRATLGRHPDTVPPAGSDGC